LLLLTTFANRLKYKDGFPTVRSKSLSLMQFLCRY